MTCASRWNEFVPRLASTQNPDALETLGDPWWRWLEHESPAPEFNAAAAQTMRSRLDQLAGPTTVFFVARKSYFNQLRLSLALRGQGLKTVAIRLGPAAGPADECRHFDAVIDTDLATLLTWTAQAKCALLHTQGWLFRYHIPTLIEAFKGPGCRQVVELMDLNSLLLPESTFARARADILDTWGTDAILRHAVQLRCERYLLDHADGVIYPGDEAMLRHLATSSHRSLRALAFPSLPLRAYFRSAEGSPAHTPALCQRLAFAGGVVSERRPKSLFADAQLLSTFEPLLAQGLKIQVFNNPLICSNSDYQRAYASHLRFEALFPGYQFGVGAAPPTINERLAAHDYGLMVYDTSQVAIGRDHFRHIMPSKLFLYLEAGLPVLVSDVFDAVARLVHKFGIGRVVSPGELEQLPQILDSLDHTRLRANVHAAREQLAMESRITDLVDLYANVWR